MVDTEHPFVSAEPGADLHHEGRRLLDDEVWRSDLADVPPRSVLAHGDPGDWLVERSRRLDLLVIGGHPRGAVHRLVVGSVGDDVVRRAHCPVLVVPEHARAAEPVPAAAPVRRGVSW